MYELFGLSIYSTTNIIPLFKLNLNPIYGDIKKNMIKQIEIKDSKYIYSSWEKFTTLTKQEEENLKEIVLTNC